MTEGAATNGKEGIKDSKKLLGEILAELAKLVKKHDVWRFSMKQVSKRIVFWLQNWIKGNTKCCHHFCLMCRYYDICRHDS